MDCMDCDAARRLIDNLLDGRLSAAEEARLRDHAASCPDCASALGAADAFAAEMAASFRAARETAPADTPRRVMRALAREGLAGRPARSGRVVWIGGAAAAFVAAAALSYILSVSSGEAPPEGDTGTALVADRGAPKRETGVAGETPDAIRGGSNGVSPPIVPEAPPEETPADFAVVVSGLIEVESPGGFVAEVDAGSVLSSGDRARATGVGAAELALPDGTRLFLKCGSQTLLAPAGKGPRSVELVSGSVFAEVQKDARPFVVGTALGDVTTLGTRFGVSLDGLEDGEAELAVTVEEGAVRVETEGGAQTVEAGAGCSFRRGADACGMSGEQCRERLRWMAEHRKRCGRGRPGGKPGGKYDEGRRHWRRPGGPDGRGRPEGHPKPGEWRRGREDAPPKGGPDDSDGRREEMRRRAMEWRRAMERKRAEEAKRAEEEEREQE